MAIGAGRTVSKLIANFKPDVIDAHFLYPDGNAASRLAARFKIPLVVTLRGSKDKRLVESNVRNQLADVVRVANAVISVSQSLVDDVSIPLGRSASQCDVIGNGVDTEKFKPINKALARKTLGISENAKVIISVGNLIELKGFHLIVETLPAVRKKFPNLIYLIVGGAVSQGDMRAEIERITQMHGLNDVVRMCGKLPSEQLSTYYSASDLFALGSSYEGWANVLLESMACGVPTIATRVGGNPEVVSQPEFGTLVDYFDKKGFEQALIDGLSRRWSASSITGHARSNSWDVRVSQLISIFNRVRQK